MKEGRKIQRGGDNDESEGVEGEEWDVAKVKEGGGGR